MIIGCTRMSPNVTGLALVWALLPWVQAVAPPACSAEATAVLDAADTAASAGEFTSAALQLRAGYAAHGSCRELVAAAWAWAGWHAAHAAAARGGSDDALTDVRAAMAAIGEPGATASASSYASAVLQAATAAAQGERDEMQVWLEHARAVASRLALVGERARWPLPIDVVVGELWARVDDYELAEASFTRALAEGNSAAAWTGLARARDRRGNRAGACEAYRRARDTVASSFPQGLVASEAGSYFVTCDR